MTARPYQAKAKDEIRELFLAGHRRALLWLATGGGKTFVFCDMVKDAAENGNKCYIVVRGRKLVDQASQRLFREGVSHGVLMAGHWNFRPRERVQVCSIDTLLSRGIDLADADFIVIDEVHLFQPNTAASVLLQGCREAFILGVTATPYVPKGLAHLCDAMVHPVTMEDLVRDGHLVPFRYFAPTQPNLDDVAISRATKDFDTQELELVMIQGALVGSIVEHWKKIAAGRPTICFAVSVSHSKRLTQMFCEAGIRAEHCDADTSDSERKAILDRSASGETQIIVNVGILCTGVDMPWISCIIFARPTLSMNLYIQQAGRGTRTSEGKSNCLILDHAGNIKRHGLPTDEPDVDLNGRITEPKFKRLTKTCKKCFATFRGTSVCPECGFEIPTTEGGVELAEADGQLVELTGEIVDPVVRAFKRLKQDAKRDGKKVQWAYHKLISRYGFEEAKRVLPEYFVSRYQANLDAIFNKSKMIGVKKDENYFS